LTLSQRDKIRKEKLKSDVQFPLKNRVLVMFIGRFSIGREASDAAASDESIASAIVEELDAVDGCLSPD
jgi:hypothetical protein